MCLRDLTAITTTVLLLLGLAGCATQGPAPVGSLEEPGPGGGWAGRPDTYRVMPGDSLYSIAWRYDLDYHQIGACNGIAPPYLIYPGQVLRLCPATASSPGPVTPAAVPTSGPVLATAESPQPLPPTAERGVTERQGAPVVKPHTAPHRTAARTLVAASVVDKGERIQWIWPTQGEVVQGFINGDRTRQGIRIAGTLGQDVVAAESGKVVYSGSGLPGYGKLIIIKHAKNYLSAYGFNRRLLVHEGSTVTKGERVAEMGSSADGKPMLHFEIRRGDAVLDPLQLLPHRK